MRRILLIALRIIQGEGAFMERVYQPYRNSKYYLALFSSIQKFIVPDLTLKINAIGN